MSKKVILTCLMLKQELEKVIAEIGFSGQIHYLPQKLKEDPLAIREYLQNQIDSLGDTDQILLCVSGCGGATVGLRATTAELVIPQTEDCIDILLSDAKISGWRRPENGMFLTGCWVDFMRESDLDLNKLTERMGEDGAEEYIRLMYEGLENFYWINTGMADRKKVLDYVMPLVKILNGTVTEVRGNFDILKKMVAGDLDSDFIVVPQGGTYLRHTPH